jgi:hypothetical protein
VEDVLDVAFVLGEDTAALEIGVAEQLVDCFCSLFGVAGG